MKLFSGCNIVGGMAILLSPFLTLAASDTLQLVITGQLVSQPCYLRAGDELVQVDMSTITDHDLAGNMRSKSKAFQIHLERCNPIVTKNVKVTFSGTSAVGDSSLLALDSSSQAKGIAVGLEEKNGTPLPINRPSQLVSITTGNMTLEFGVYVKVLSANELKPGYFKASAQFKLDYE
ncbi:type 1 fimbrial protein [Aeromonas jandaei]|uniref:fimbrial protein n=1 Tax=Aeromonas jandaei TaxID=650 RepID=UPI001F2700DC|nr:fimbrial protein [Aeromonas jandaei]MCF7719929.1 type 1 fimbrial protein [Aeromonas jandaei]